MESSPASTSISCPSLKRNNPWSVSLHVQRLSINTFDDFKLPCIWTGLFCRKCMPCWTINWWKISFDEWDYEFSSCYGIWLKCSLFERQEMFIFLDNQTNLNWVTQDKTFFTTNCYSTNITKGIQLLSLSSH